MDRADIALLFAFVLIVGRDFMVSSFFRKREVEL